MYDPMQFKDALKIEYLKIYIIYDENGGINTEKTLNVLSKCIPEFSNNWNKDLPLTIDSIYDYLKDNNYVKAMVRTPNNNKYVEITFQRDLNEIKIKT